MISARPDVLHGTRDFLVLQKKRSARWIWASPAIKGVLRWQEARS